MSAAAIRAYLSVVALIVGIGLVATSGLAGPRQQEGGTLRIGRGGDLDSVDPALAYLPASWTIVFATCAKLYNYPGKPGRPGAVEIPEVATGFPTVSRNGRTQTIRLRRSYRFHTGARITAANFVAAFNRLANPQLESPAAAYLHEIAGADAVIEGRAQTISGVRASGRYTLEIRTTRRVPDLAARLTMPFFCPVAVSTPPREVDDPIGSGPYYVASRVRNRQVVLERNRFYRGPRPAHVDRAVWTIGVGGEACRAAVERNELDVCASFLPSSAYPELAATYGINRRGGQFHFNPIVSTDYLAFNHDRPAFRGVGQIPLKQAINWAIDRPALVRAGGFLAGRRTDQVLPPAMAAAASLYPLGGVSERTLRRARASLAKARLKPQRLVLYSPNADPYPLRARIVQFNLRRLGIDVDLVFLAPPAWLEKTATRGEPFDLTFSGWSADYTDAAVFMRLLDGRSITASGNANIAYFDRPRYNRAIERIDRLRGEARRKAWAALDISMMRADPPWVPYANGVRSDFISKSFGCYYFHPLYWLDIAAACKK